MKSLKIKKVKQINPKTKVLGFSIRVVSNGRIGAEQISEEACENTTLHPDEALLANKLFIKKIAKYIREGYIVELGEIGTLQPGCTSTWAATKEELSKDVVKTHVNFNPSDEVESAIKGAKLSWASDDDSEGDPEEENNGGGNNGGGGNPDENVLG